MKRTICNLRPKRQSRSAGRVAQKIDLHKYNKNQYTKMDKLAKIISTEEKFLNNDEQICRRYSNEFREANNK